MGRLLHGDLLAAAKDKWLMRSLQQTCPAAALLASHGAHQLIPIICGVLGVAQVRMLCVDLAGCPNFACECMKACLSVDVHAGMSLDRCAYVHVHE